jgi:hypothetical protein
VRPEESEHVRRGVRSYLELKGRYLADDHDRAQTDADVRARIL